MCFILRIASFMALSLAYLSAAAQIVIQADSAGLQPQIGRDDIGFLSCGVRAVVTTSNAGYVDAYDFSLMVRADIPYGTLKAGKVSTPIKAALKGKYATGATTPPPTKFWLAQENEGKPISPMKIMPAENKGYILELADLADTLRGIVAMIHGQRMQFAVRYKSQPVEQVISFSAAMPENELAPLMTCLNAVVERFPKVADKSGD
jgi:hypothetical protein